MVPAAQRALAGVGQAAAQRVQVLALVELPGDPPPVGLIGQVPGGLDGAAQRAVLLDRGTAAARTGRTGISGITQVVRIRDLGKITLYRARGRAEVCAQFPVAGPLLTRRINFQLIAENWDEMLRLAASLKYGHVTASLIVAKPDYRRKIGRQLNKGESMHALRRDVFYAHEGAIRRRHLQHQNDQAWCLPLAANAITAWTTEYLGLAVQQLRSQGRLVDDTLLAHMSPAQSGTHRADRHHHRRHRPRTRPTRPHRPPRPSQAFRRDTSAMTDAADRLYERIVIRTESEPIQRRRSSRPIGVRGTPVMDTALDEKKESRPSRACSRPSGSSVTPAACCASSPPAWRFRLVRIWAGIRSGQVLVSLLAGGAGRRTGRPGRGRGLRFWRRSG